MDKIRPTKEEMSMFVGSYVMRHVILLLKFLILTFLVKMGFPQFTMEDFFDTFMDTLETLQKVKLPKTMTLFMYFV